MAWLLPADCHCMELLDGRENLLNRRGVEWRCGGGSERGGGEGHVIYANINRCKVV